MTTSEISIGIDIGGTKMLCVTIDASRPRDVLERQRVVTPTGLDAVIDAVDGLVTSIAPDPACPVGIGIPGLIDTDDRFLFGANLPGVENVPMGDLLRSRLARPVAVDNDATCATVAEFRVGAGTGARDGILLTIGTGIGGGLVIDGEVRRGTHGFAGEPGHMMIDPAGPRCPCGSRGCWERYASGSGLGRLGREAAIAGRLDAAVARAGGDVEGVRGEHVVDAARDGDPQAGEVLDDFAWWMAAGIANLVDLLDPEVVVLGGGVMSSADVLLHRVTDAVSAHVLAGGRRPPVDIVVAHLGEEAGAIGAAMLAADGEVDQS